MLVPCENDECKAIIPAGSGPTYTGFCESCDDTRASLAAGGERRDDG